MFTIVFTFKKSSTSELSRNTDIIETFTLGFSVLMKCAVFRNVTGVHSSNVLFVVLGELVLHDRNSY